jgi:ubiquinol-cytochrome c reductase cytochrome b subunit
VKPVNPEQKSTTPSVPDLLRKEVLAAVLSISAVALLSAWLDAPLQGPADIAGIPPEHVKAPWIFVGIQQMLRYLPAVIAGVLAPLAALAFSAAIPLLHPRKPAVPIVIFSGVWIVLGLVTLWGYFA